MKDVRLLAYYLDRWKGSQDISIYCLWSEIRLGLTLYGVHFLPMEYVWDGWWSKMNLFGPSLETIRPFLYMDLDTVILKEYADVFPKGEKAKEFTMLKDFYRPTLPASGLMWIPKLQGDYRFWDQWCLNAPTWMKKYRGDQEVLRVYNPAKQFFQDSTTLIGSMKPEPRKLPLQERPKDKAIVCFHGKPSIAEASKEINWIDEYVKEGEANDRW